MQFEQIPCWSKSDEPGVDPNWGEIEASAAFALPPCKAWLGVLAHCVRDQAPELLVELSRFQKAFACTDSGPSRALGSEFFEKLVSIKFGPTEKYPFLVNAAVQANLISPRGKVVDGYCRLLTPASLALLSHKDNRASVAEAESLMSTCRLFADSLWGRDSSERVKLIGKLDVRLVLHLTKKAKEGEGRVFGSIAEIAEAPRDQC